MSEGLDIYVFHLSHQVIEMLFIIPFLAKTVLHSLPDVWIRNLNYIRTDLVESSVFPSQTVYIDKSMY